MVYPPCLVIGYLLHPGVECILFPFDEAFPRYALAKSQMQGASGLLSLFVRAPARAEIVPRPRAGNPFSMVKIVLDLRT
jgi:hypothetical protein